MKRYTRILLVVTITFAALIQSTLAQVEWQKVTDHEAGFIISFPGKPTYQQLSNPVTGDPMEQYSFQLNDHHLMISIQILADPPRTAAEITQMLGNTAQVYARGAGTLLRQEKLPDGGRQYDNIKVDDIGTLRLRTRIYLHQGRFYTLTCGTYSLAGIDERVVHRFYSSFSFTDAPTHKASTPGKLPRSAVSARRERSGWYTLRGADRDFIVEFPGKPSHEVDPDQKNRNVFHQYIYSSGENSFIVSYREKYREENDASLEQMIRQYANNFVAKHEGWQVLRQTRLRDGNYQIESEGPLAGSLIHMRTRLYLRGTRIYFVSTMTKNLIGPNKDDLEKFFASFRLL